MLDVENNAENPEMEQDSFHFKKYILRERFYGRSTKEILPFIPGKEVRLGMHILLNARSYKRRKNWRNY